jgi:hypothetical protein
MGVAARPGIAVAIGGVTVRFHSSDAAFLDMIERRYADFVSFASDAVYEFEIELSPVVETDPDEDVCVRREGDRWLLSRGDFRAEWDPSSRRGRIRQSPNPYSIDAVLRIVHTLVLAEEGGFLVHGASAIRNGKAFLFAGVSGAGKTTISRLAPAEATLLTDEISYVRKEGDGYVAYGTPFAGELAKPGENVRAPVGALYLLAKGLENRIEPIPVLEAARGLLTNILFFAHDPDLVAAVFRSACEFVEAVPVSALTFFPDERVWELIR